MTEAKSESLTDQYLKTLSLHRIREYYRDEAEKAAKAKLGYQDYLQRLLEIEVLSKIERSINRKMQIAGFPQIKRLEEFDFSYQPQINEKLIRELALLNFLDETKNILFVGAPGVGNYRKFLLMERFSDKHIRFRGFLMKIFP